jgi:hypothetical protein
MDAVSLMREQLNTAHEWLEGTMADVTPEQAKGGDIGRATPIGAAYAHVVLSEDMLIQGMLRGTAPLSATEWAGKTGASADQPMPGPGQDWETIYGEWKRGLKVDLPAMREYAKAVYAKSDEYLASLSAADLDRTMDLAGLGMGKATLGWALGRLVVAHVDQMCGEISAIKGIKGAKGYPF